jgi:nitrite reductase/ring-hydroxylating ferredoxin subunit
MGGPLSEGCYNSAKVTLQCAWHGYIFDVDSGTFKENPNETVYASMRTPSSLFVPGSRPPYRLQVLEYELIGDEIFIGRPGY